MNHKIWLDNKKKIIFCTLEGELNIEEAISLSRKLRGQAAELEYHLLYEASKLREPESNMPVHDFTVKLSSILDATIHRNIKVAFVYEPGSYDGYWQFYENAAKERGLKIRVFPDENDALQWLS